VQVSTYSVTSNMISEARQVIQNDITIPTFWRGKIKEILLPIQFKYTITSNQISMREKYVKIGIYFLRYVIGFY
jgi:hypothetical protein